MRITEYGFDLPEQPDQYDIDQYSDTIQKINDMLKDINTEIEVLDSNSDVVDVVSVYNRGSDISKTDIVHYDTSHLTNNAIIKVLADETQNNAISYYRFTKNNLLPPTWSHTLIGTIGPYLTTTEINTLLNNSLPKVEEIN